MRVQNFVDGLSNGVKFTGKLIKQAGINFFDVRSPREVDRDERLKYIEKQLRGLHMNNEKLLALG
jgi:hypothetical protein